MPTPKQRLQKLPGLRRGTPSLTSNSSNRSGQADPLTPSSPLPSPAGSAHEAGSPASAATSGASSPFMLSPKPPRFARARNFLRMPRVVSLGVLGTAASPSSSRRMSSASAEERPHSDPNTNHSTTSSKSSVSSLFVPPSLRSLPPKMPPPQGIFSGASPGASSAASPKSPKSRLYLPCSGRRALYILGLGSVREAREARAALQAALLLGTEPVYTLLPDHVMEVAVRSSDLGETRAEVAAAGYEIAPDGYNLFAEALRTKEAHARILALYHVRQAALQRNHDAIARPWLEEKKMECAIWVSKSLSVDQRTDAEPKSP